MLEAFFYGFLALFQPSVLLAWLAGTMIGLIVGVIPVIGPLETFCLLLPFIFKMNLEVGLVLLMSIGAVSTMGGSITSILLNIPGDAPNAATCIDGYPMTRRGEAGRAIGAAITSNGLAAIMTVLLALVMIPLVIPMVMHLWSAEMFFLVIMGIAFLSSLGKGSQVKGLIAGGVGILISFVGRQVLTGVPRFTFGILPLYDGVDLIPVLLGLFGLSEIIDLAATGQTIAQTGAVTGGFRDLLQGMKDVFRHIWLWFRCVIIGYIVGILPGIGHMTSTFLAYAHGKQTSNHPEKFGTGTVEGVIAPEAGNSSSMAGDLLCTLALGIPGSAGMTLILAAFLILGIVPGPGMLLDHLQLSFTMMLTCAIGVPLGAFFCFWGSRYLIRLANVNPRYLFCTVVPIIFVGCFIRGETMLNILLVIIFGVLGLLMKRWNFSRPSLALGYILGELCEYYFWTSLQFEGPFFFMRPISLFVIAVTAFVISYDYIKPLFRRRPKEVKKS